jgi:RecJ-like exonuclease
METAVPSKLLSTLSQAADIVRGHDFINVFSHYDADGVSAAAIIAKTLIRAEKEFRLTLFTTLNDQNMGVIRNTKAECIIVTDLGASYIDQMDQLSCDVVVLDHHTIISEAKRVCYANPHLYGIDGMTSGCGATMALLFSVAMSEDNWDLVQIAFAGIAGDRQHIKGLSGLNTYLLEEGVRRGFIEEMPGSLIPAGKLKDKLFLCTDPYIRGVTGNAQEVARLLADCAIPEDADYMDLDDDQRRKLSTLLAIRLTKQGVQESSMAEIARKRYYLKRIGMDAEQLSGILNSCGRAGVGGMGVSAGIGDSESLQKGAEIEKESAAMVAEAMCQLDEAGLHEMENIQWFDSTDSGFTGMLCGIAMQSIGNPDKPTIGMNRSYDPVNLSSRGMWNQLDAGVDLAVAMREACASVGGEGGGHRIAAGGSVPADKADEFLKNLDAIVGKQKLSASR